MMKCFRYLWPLLLLAVNACLGPGSPSGGHPEGGRERVTVSFDPSGLRYGTRSTAVSDESQIGNVNLFLYRDGRLEWQEYRTGPDPLTLELLSGERYSVYALANVGRRQAPASESGMHAFVLDLPPDSEAGLIPMASDGGLSVTPGSDGPDVTVVLLRLAAKFNFRVDCSALQYGSFTVESARIRQESRTVDVFSPESRAGSVSDLCDGDAASQDDLDRLNRAGAIAFYAMENRQGTLLPGNADPWRKAYSDPQVAALASCCTYLEVQGSYRDRSGGLRETRTYRMFLGEDATTNFDITRNTEYTLTLVLSDLGAYHDSWKVERGGVQDGRTLYFDPEVVDIASLGEGSARIVSDPPGVDYTLAWDEESFRAAFLTDPALSGATVSVRNTAELEEDASVLLRAVSFDGAVGAVCTLRVSSASLPELEVEWSSTPPAYVAQAGVVHCSPLPEGSTLVAASDDPNVGRLVDLGNGDFRIEARKEGRTTLRFTRTDGSHTSTQTLELRVAPVYLQGSGERYRAYPDGSVNACRIDDGSLTPWALSYNLPRESFDAALYAELLTPQYTAVRSDGGGEGVDYFDIDEEGLYVVRWGAGLLSLAGTYQVSLTPRSDIYAGVTAPLERTVVVEAPIRLASDSVLRGENRYYMPDPGEAMTLSLGGVTLGLGDPSQLRLCVGFPTGGYGEGSGYLPCSFQSGPDGEMVVSITYEDLLRNFPAPYRLRGEHFRLFGRLTNARSAQTEDFLLCSTEIYLSFAVTARLYAWDSRSSWDVTGEDHLFLVPCLYEERFEPGLFTFQSSQAGGAGDLSLPPFYLPRYCLTGIPDRISVGGATIYLSETLPNPWGAARPALPDYVLTAGSNPACPDLTNWLWNEASWAADDYDREAYQSLFDQVGGWYHHKLYWHLYDPNARTVVPEGGFFDIRSYGGFTGNYYLRFHDYAEPLDASEFDE